MFWEYPTHSVNIALMTQGKTTAHTNYCCYVFSHIFIFWNLLYWLDIIFKHHFIIKQNLCSRTLMFWALASQWLTVTDILLQFWVLASPSAGVWHLYVCVCVLFVLCVRVCAVCVCSPAGFPATAYGPVAAAAVAAARGSGRGARGRGGYLAYPQSAGPGKRSVHVLCGCCSLSNFSRSASPCRLFTHPPHKAPHAHTPRATICYDWPRFTQIRAEISSYKAHGPLSLPLWSAPDNIWQG